MPARCATAPWVSPARRAPRSRRRSCAANGRSPPRWRSALARQIARLAEPAALERLVEAAGRLHKARRVYCLGLRSCHSAAWHFHYMLSLLGDKTVMLDDAGGTGLDAIRDAGPQRRRCWPPASSPMPAPPSRRALRGGPGRAGGGADRFRSLAARPARLGDHPGGDRQPLLLSHHDAAAGRHRDPGGPGRGPRRQQGAGGARPHRGAALGVRRPPAAAWRQARKHDPYPASPDRRHPAGRRRRPGHRDRRHQPASATSTPRAAPPCPASATAIPR